MKNLPDPLFFLGARTLCDSTFYRLWGTGATALIYCSLGHSERFGRNDDQADHGHDRNHCRRRTYEGNMGAFRGEMDLRFRSLGILCWPSFQYRTSVGASAVWFLAHWRAR